jgi:heme a synthase
MTPTDRKHIQIWYWSGAVLVFLILVIGGITRLTQSGLSMVEWNPIMGVIPPLTEADWLETFNKYREFPEYQHHNRGMSLDDFKFIFFWEYLHRMIGRLIGLVFVIPFGWFVIRKKFSPQQLRRALLLLLLGLTQGFMGWYMVKSGLVDVPYVSPYRLAAHLLIAFAIFGCCIWFALDLKRSRYQFKGNRSSGYHIRWWLAGFIIILILQVTWGAFTAGLNAGHVYNTFPKMNQFWVPPEAWMLEPFVQNLFENPAAVQWIHRVLGTFLIALVIYIWAKTMFSDADTAAKWWSVVLLGMVLIQYLTGIIALLLHVPVVLAVIHQAFAMLLFGAAIGYYHYVIRNLSGQKPNAIAERYL